MNICSNMHWELLMNSPTFDLYMHNLVNGLFLFVDESLNCFEITLKFHIKVIETCRNVHKGTAESWKGKSYWIKHPDVGLSGLEAERVYGLFTLRLLWGELYKTMSQDSVLGCEKLSKWRSLYPPSPQFLLKSTGDMFLNRRTWRVRLKIYLFNLFS